MVQMFYYENYGKCWRKLWKFEGEATKVHLHPEEGFPSTSANVHWLLKRPWWSRTQCKITEVCGGRKYKTKGKIVDLGRGVTCIKGKFKHFREPDFRLNLTSHVSGTDFRLGYSMAGFLEQGNKKDGRMNITHYAMIKRKDY